MSNYQCESNSEISKWKTLDAGGPIYRIMKKMANLVYCFQITDLIDLYQEELKFDEFTVRWDKLNKGQFLYRLPRRQGLLSNYNLYN